MWKFFSENSTSASTRRKGRKAEAQKIDEEAGK